MAKTSNYLALDLGAESGRGLLGRFDGERLELEELHRFPNGPVRMLDTLYWDLPRLFEELKTALRKGAAGGELDGVGVDTWGVNFGLIGRGDTLMGNPVHYRDARTDGMLEAAFQLVPRERIYEITGLQFLPFNTVYQLLALARAKSPHLECAETMLMMPDLFGWLLTGRRAGERTDASTTQLLDPNRGAWSDELCRDLGIPRAILPDLIEPGSELGPIRRPLVEELGLPRPVTVIAPATHDTASAVAAVPVKAAEAFTSSSPSPSSPPDWCYLSSGTWSLLGVEVPRPVITAETMRYNFTNEGGVAGTIRLLKNIMGLWLVQESRRTWARAGREWSYEELTARAQVAPLFRPDRSRRRLVPGPRRHARAALGVLHADRTDPPDRRGGDRPVLPGEPGAEIPVGDRPSRGHAGHHDPDDPRGRRRGQERLALPVHRRRVRPPGPRGTDRGYGDREYLDAGPRPRPAGLDRRAARGGRALVPRHDLRAARHRRLGRRRRPLRAAGPAVVQCGTGFQPV